jgi:lipid A 3-O-deacylase
MMKALAVAACVLCVTYSGVAAAGPVDEVRGGVYLQGCCGFGSDKEDGAAFNGEVLFNSPRFLSIVGAPRPLVGATVATDGDATSQIYSGLEWKINISRWFVAAGAGVAVHNGETDTYDPVADAARASETVFFGCRVVFRIAGDAGYRVTDRISASFHWNHLSNAELCRNNEGLDQMGFRIGVRL